MFWANSSSPHTGRLTQMRAGLWLNIFPPGGGGGFSSGTRPVMPLITSLHASGEGVTLPKGFAGRGRRCPSGDGCRELSLGCYIRSLCWPHPRASSDPSSSVLTPAEATLLLIHRGGTERLDRVARDSPRRCGFAETVPSPENLLPLPRLSLPLSSETWPKAASSWVFVDPLS